MASRFGHKTVRLDDLPLSVPVTLRDLLTARIPIPISVAVAIVVECMQQTGNRPGDGASVALSPERFVITHDVNGRLSVSMKAASIDDGASRDEEAPVRTWDAILYQLLTTRPADCREPLVSAARRAPSPRGPSARTARLIGIGMLGIGSALALWLGVGSSPRHERTPLAPRSVEIKASMPIQALRPRIEASDPVATSTPPSSAVSPSDRGERDNAAPTSRPSRGKRVHKMDLIGLQRELSRINGDPRR